MKWYSEENYNRFKTDLKNQPEVEIDLDDHQTIINKFIYLPELITKKFNKTEPACGRLNVEDLIQEGMVALCIASKMVDKDMVGRSTDKEKLIASYLSERIWGRMRRFIDLNRGTIRVSEAKTIKIRNNEDVDEDVKSTFFGNVLTQIEDGDISNNRMVVDHNGDLREYNYGIVVAYILAVFNSNLNKEEVEILRHWYGLNTSKKTLYSIAKLMGERYYPMRICDIKNEAIKKIENKINKGLVVDFLFS